MPRSSGDRLDHFEILAPIGTGGMGEVYKARDTRIDRLVAIKFVSEKFSDRFDREARSISALNHPHICTLFDIGPDFLVMELVDGETLAARLQRGRLPMELVLRYGAQIADALAAAHGRGIVHRDLKPGNIMVTKSGTKVLDFGLAKTMPGDETVTTSGVIMGTPAYMAPEQLDGRTCDARTDIFALGLVLHEMATGKRLKSGDSANLENFPERVAHIVERCLEPEPENRWQSAIDVKAELEWARKTKAAAFPRKSLPRWVWAMASLACVGLIAVATAIVSRDPAPAPYHPARFILSFEQTLEPLSMPKPSPDGRYLVFSARDTQGSYALWLRPLDSLNARQLSGTEGATISFWSPDGRWIGFFAEGKLKKISPDGSPPRNIMSLPRVEEAAWGASGDILYRPANRSSLYRIHESGGSPREATKLDGARAENSHRAPDFLPDGRRFLFSARCGQREHNALYVGSLDSHDVRRLMPVQSNVRYIPPRNGSPGVLLYYRDSMLVAHRFDADSEKLVGDPIPLVESIEYNATGALASFEVSKAGNLIILRPVGANDTRLTWFDRSGGEIGVTGPRGDYFQPRLSPIGDRIAFSRPDEQTGNRDVWSLEVARGVAARLTTHGANDWFPIWSPDGTQMVFGSDREGGIENSPYIKKSMDPGAQEFRMPHNWHELGVLPSPFDWSPDGQWVSVGVEDIWIAPISGDRTPFAFLATPFREGGARFSPDGNWIAYVSDETGRVEVYIRPFAGKPAGGEGKIQVSNSGGDSPVWRVDGQELFYRGSDLHLYAVSTRDLSRAHTPPPPLRLFRECPETSSNYPRVAFSPWTYEYDTRDGQRFVFSCRAEPPGSFTVLMNWATRRQ